MPDSIVAALIDAVAQVVVALINAIATRTAPKDAKGRQPKHLRRP